MFENIDISELFDIESEYGRSFHLGSFTNEDISCVEEYFGVPVPKSFISFLKLRNGGLIKDSSSALLRIGGIAEDENAANSLETLDDETGWQMPIIGIPFGEVREDHCARYSFDDRKRTGEPGIVLIKPKNDFRNAEILFVANDFEEFLQKVLKKEDISGIPFAPVRALFYTFGALDGIQDKLEEIVKYASALGITDLYLQHTEALTTDLNDALDLIPKAPMRLHLCLSRKNHWLTYSDYLEAKEYRKDISLHPAIWGDDGLTHGNTLVTFVNETISRDALELMDYPPKGTNELLIYRSVGFSFSNWSSGKFIATIPDEKISEEVLLEISIDGDNISGYKIEQAEGAFSREVLFDITK